MKIQDGGIHKKYSVNNVIITSDGKVLVDNSYHTFSLFIEGVEIMTIKFRDKITISNAEITYFSGHFYLTDLRQYKNEIFNYLKNIQ